MKNPRKKQLNSQATPVYRSDGRAVGRVEGGVFRRVMRSTVHQLQRPPAWAADVDALDQARAAGASQVEIFDRDTGETYRAELADFYRHGVRVSRGHGVQLALPLGRWSVTMSLNVGNRPLIEGPSQMRLF